MKFTAALVSLLVTAAAAAGVPRPSAHQEGVEMSITTNHETLKNGEFKQHSLAAAIEASNKKRNQKRRAQRQRHLGKGRSETAAPTPTPRFWFDVDSDGDDTLTTVLNGSFEATDLDEDEKELECFGNTCKGTYLAKITGEPAGSGCSMAKVSATSTFGQPRGGDTVFSIFCPGTGYQAQGDITKCTDTTTLMDAVDPTICTGVTVEEDAAAVEFTIDANDRYIEVVVQCCPLP